DPARRVEDLPALRLDEACHEPCRVRRRRGDAAGVRLDQPAADVLERVCAAVFAELTRRRGKVPGGGGTASSHGVTVSPWTALCWTARRLETVPAHRTASLVNGVGFTDEDAGAEFADDLAQPEVAGRGAQ